MKPTSLHGRRIKHVFFHSRKNQIKPLSMIQGGRMRANMKALVSRNTYGMTHDFSLAFYENTKASEPWSLFPTHDTRFCRQWCLHANHCHLFFQIIKMKPTSLHGRRIKHVFFHGRKNQIKPLHDPITWHSQMSKKDPICEAYDRICQRIPLLVGNSKHRWCKFLQL